jgi:hypothetical protein
MEVTYVCGTLGSYIQDLANPVLVRFNLFSSAYHVSPILPCFRTPRLPTCLLIAPVSCPLRLSCCRGLHYLITVVFALPRSSQAALHSRTGAEFCLGLFVHGFLTSLLFKHVLEEPWCGTGLPAHGLAVGLQSYSNT